MKTRKQWTWTSVFLMSSIILLGGVYAALAFGQGTLSAVEILNEVKALHVPSVGYTASISQHISGMLVAGQVSSVPDDTGKVRFVPSGGLQRMPENAKRAPVQMPTPKITIDLGKFIDELLTSSDLTIKEVNLDTLHQYEVRGTDATGQMECVMWIKVENKQVTQVHMYIDGQPFSEIDFEYSVSRKGYWLPDQIQIHHFTDDSQVSLEFSDYTFE